MVVSHEIRPVISESFSQPQLCAFANAAAHSVKKTMKVILMCFGIIIGSNIIQFWCPGLCISFSFLLHFAVFETNTMQVLYADVFFFGKYFPQTRNKNIQTSSHEVIVVAPQGFKNMLAFKHFILII